MLFLRLFKSLNTVYQRLINLRFSRELPIRRTNTQPDILLSEGPGVRFSNPKLSLRGLYGYVFRVPNFPPSFANAH